MIWCGRGQEPPSEREALLLPHALRADLNMPAITKQTSEKRATILLVDTGVGHWRWFAQHGFEVSGDDGPLEGHGTRVAAVLCSAAPGARVVSVRIGTNPVAAVRRAAGIPHDFALFAWGVPICEGLRSAFPWASGRAFSVLHATHLGPGGISGVHVVPHDVAHNVRRYGISGVGRSIGGASLVAAVECARAAEQAAAVGPPTDQPVPSDNDHPLNLIT